MASEETSMFSGLVWFWVSWPCGRLADASWIRELAWLMRARALVAALVMAWERAMERHL